jgi:HNH endonuclease
MTVSKALRFEVLRRDGFACTYCGRKPPEVELHVDHVIPNALGGPETAENLRSSCVDCNSGKGSTHPDAEMVAQVADDAQRWAEAIKAAAEEAAAAVGSDDLDWFLTHWNGYHYGYESHTVPLPFNWKQSIRKWVQVGLPPTVVLEMVDVAMSRTYIPAGEVFNYFAGCCWRQVTAMQERAAEIIAESGPE